MYYYFDHWPRITVVRTGSSVWSPTKGQSLLWPDSSVWVDFGTFPPPLWRHLRQITLSSHVATWHDLLLHCTDHQSVFVWSTPQLKCRTFTHLCGTRGNQALPIMAACSNGEFTGLTYTLWSGILPQNVRRQIFKNTVSASEECSDDAPLLV